MTSDIPEFEMRLDDQGRIRFIHGGQARAYLRQFAGREDIVAQFYPFRAKRSARQNRALHPLLHEWLRCENRKGWSIDGLKYWLLGEVFGRVECHDPKTGEVFLIPSEMHTSTLSVGQFCQLIEGALEYAAEDGVYLMAPDEYRKAKEKAQRQAARAAQKGRAA